jgi:menaquinone-dependent protoporphyrinogen oxidase
MTHNAERNHGVIQVGIFYATREGQTKRIAEHIAAALRRRGIDVKVGDLRARATDIQLSSYAAVILAASVHAGRHEKEMVAFVKAHIDDLEHLHTAFLSVTLSQAGVERRGATAEERARFEADVHAMLSDFFEQTGWHPKHVKPVAGALLYSRYSMLVRFVMKRIAKKAGAETDTSHDYEYTDWRALDRFADEFAAEIASGQLVRSRT